MKKFLLAAGLFLTGASARAQIALEQVYAADITAYKISTGDVKYVGYFPSVGQIRIYNANHSVYRQAAFTPPANFQVQQIEYLSDRLFNSTPGLEMVVNMFNASVGASRMEVIDEAGANVITVDSSSYPQIFNSAAGTKMVANVYTPTRVYAKVYSLPGTYTALRTQEAKLSETAAPFPNPAADQITLPYRLQPGQSGTLTVFTSTGRQVASYNIDSTFDHLLLNARSLRPGVYSYQLTVNGQPGGSQRFTVTR